MASCFYSRETVRRNIRMPGLLIMRVNLMMTEFNNEKVAYVLEQRIENIKLLIFV